MRNIEIIANICPKKDTPVKDYAFEAVEDVRRLHKGVKGYAPTQLVSLKKFAKECGIKGMLVKDESTRFNEQAFKPLGGIYAIFRVICQELGLDYHTTTLGELLQEPFHSKITKMVFITTTDGNHGRGVSWASSILGSKSYVFMPKGTVEVRAEKIRKAGNATVTITEMLYDDCVKYTAKLARENGWHLIQDTSWDGYEEVPHWIMLGYTTMAYEAILQMKEMGFEQPTHVFLQAGVGSMAGAVAACMKATFGDKCPIISMVEPTEVACMYESMRKGDGRPYTSHGSNFTIMAGLNCATPCNLAWKLIRDYSQFAITMSDDITEQGMRTLAKNGIISGESGASTSGLVDVILHDPSFSKAKELLGINQDSVILVFSTEGDTDPENYKRIIDNKQ